MAPNLLRIDRLPSRALPAGTRSDWTIGNFPVLRQQIQHCGHRRKKNRANEPFSV
jgi:hypothetical protein